jgi:beta-phosphoglucomutase-like phosphatase (HAD superfamily)
LQDNKFAFTFDLMRTDAVIFDMDGLLIDSEPYWQEAGKETLLEFDKTLTTAQYHSSTGLRTEEWIAHWFNHFGIDNKHRQKILLNKCRDM